MDLCFKSLKINLIRVDYSHLLFLKQFKNYRYL